MTDFHLFAPQDAAKMLAGLLLGSGRAALTVQEDKAFLNGGHWSLGQVEVYGDLQDPKDLTQAVNYGAYDWQIPALDTARSELLTVLGIVEPDGTAKDAVKEAYRKTTSRVDRVLDTVAAASTRLGLAHPVLDPKAVEGMPFRRSTTVIADTSGVLQGGLDFVARFLHPSARLKVPAVVHMEVVNQADNYMKRRRANKINTSATLLDHLLSQAGQRALLRLEMRSDTEVERTPLIGDPLRNAFHRDTDQEWSELNMSVPLRSYCDRLILEAARQHQTHASPGHPVVLLTCDQGLARMALAEGVDPLFFNAIPASAFFGRKLVGTNFHPFDARLYSVPLSHVIWELATAFGSARLTSEDGSRWLEVAAIGSHLSWTPMHSRNDLLWMRWEGFDPADLTEAGSMDPQARPVAAQRPARAPKALKSPLETKAAVPKRAPKASAPRAPRLSADGLAYYRLAPERALTIAWDLATAGVISERAAGDIAKVATPSALGEYKRFFLAGDFIRVAGESWEATDHANLLFLSLASADVRALEEALSRVPVLKNVFEAVRSAPTGEPFNLPVPDRALTTYRTFAELVCLAAPIGETGLFPTPNRPSLKQFVDLAMTRFEELDAGERFVAVGAWLEALIRQDGIHPEISRRLLDEAVASKLIGRSTEGSTTDTRHDKHAIRVLRATPVGPMVQTVHIYRGDFLLPDKSSSSLRLWSLAQ